VFVDAAAAHSELETIGALTTSRPSLLSHEEENEVAKKRRQTVATLLRPQLNQDGEESGRHLSQASIRSSGDKHKPPKVLASSIGEPRTWDPESKVFSSGTLASLVKSYPKGNIWSIDFEGYTSSLGLINEWEISKTSSRVEKRRSATSLDSNRQRTEAVMLSQIFPTARQIMFLPIWDAGAGKLGFASVISPEQHNSQTKALYDTLDSQQ
jgi:hypothetical protein